MIIGNPITLGGGGSGGKTQFSLVTTQRNYTGAVINLSTSNNSITDISSNFTVSGNNLICNKGGVYQVESFIFTPANLGANSNSLSIRNAADDSSLYYHYASVSSSSNDLSNYSNNITLTTGQEIYFMSVLGGSTRTALGLIILLEV